MESLTLKPLPFTFRDILYLLAYSLFRLSNILHITFIRHTAYITIEKKRRLWIYTSQRTNPKSGLEFNPAKKKKKGIIESPSRGEGTGGLAGGEERGLWREALLFRSCGIKGIKILGGTYVFLIWFCLVSE
jgi:hypothetical protein